MIATSFTQASYIVAAALFILSLKWLSRPDTARRGVRAGEIGMGLAIAGTLVQQGIVSYQWILVGFVLGAAIGLPMAVWMPMTHVPQRTALSHAFGALAAALVGTSEYYLHTVELSTFTMAVLSLEVVLGFLTFTGSLMAFGKLQDLIPSRPLVYKGQNVVHFDEKPYIRLLEEIGPIKVWIVDGGWVRQHIEKEFTNFCQGHHPSFREKMPADEFWIEMGANESEIPFFVDHLLVERYCLEQGKSFNAAEEEATKVEQGERKRA